jgi:hypothetical protein
VEGLPGRIRPAIPLSLQLCLHETDDAFLDHRQRQPVQIRLERIGGEHTVREDLRAPVMAHERIRE